MSRTRTRRVPRFAIHDAASPYPRGCASPSPLLPSSLESASSGGPGSATPAPRVLRRFRSVASATRRFSFVLLATLAFAPLARTENQFLRGDANDDGEVNLSDAVLTLDYLFRGGAAPRCLDAADANDDGFLSLPDSVYLLTHLFRGGAEPPPPHPGCGVDLSDDNLGCEASACGPASAPSILAVSITPSGLGESLIYDSAQGFRQDVSFIRIWGRELAAVTEIIVSDAFGFERRLPRSESAVFEGEHTNGYESIAVSLHDHFQDVRLLFNEPRNEMGVEVQSSAGRSNRFEVPVVLDEQDVDALGVTINALALPVGVSTGPVWIEYSARDRIVDAAWRLAAEFSVDGGESWMAARSRTAERENDGEEPFAGGPGVRREGALFPAGGALRTFVWDGCHDESFLALQDGSARRWEIRFRLRPRLDLGSRLFNAHSIETPPIEYLYLPDCGADAPIGELVESFESLARADDASTADWNAPGFPGVLRAAPRSFDRFGTGTQHLILARRVPPESGASHYEIDTDELLIRHVLVDDRAPGGRVVTPLALDNPGAARGEFHLARLEIAVDTRVIARGSRPLVIRLAGEGPTTPEHDEVLRIEGTLDLRGSDGDPLTGEGGAGGAGGGRGGDGARLSLRPGTQRVLEFHAATDGENSGGRGGETPASFSPDLARGSTFAGSWGGGGGHLTRGQDGLAPSEALVPVRAGAGGAARGEISQTALTTGSGGGGGGGSAWRTGTQGGAALGASNGGGGGGGGGGLLVESRGALRISGWILANGGLGAPGAAGSVPGSTSGAPGGGGSGGAIVLRALGPVTLADADRLQVRGGQPAIEPRGFGGEHPGHGAPGRVRVESARSITPGLVRLHARTLATVALRNSRTAITLEVESTAAFPETGTLDVEGERMHYLSKSETTLDGLVREPQLRRSHPVGAVVALVGSVAPEVERGVVETEGIAETDLAIEQGAGVDGAVDLPFVPGRDPQTGELTLDPETGRAVAIYTLDTASRELRDPDGSLILTGRAERSRGLELAALSIERDVILRVSGSEPALLRVLGEAHIEGTIDVSGEPGGPLLFDPTESLALPLPGLGGRGGPGGANGGAGGNVEFLDGDPGNRDPGNVRLSAGESGRLPRGANVAAASGGESLDGACMPCIETAVGGGGGGNLRDGIDGSALRPEDVRAVGGASFGEGSISVSGELHLVGGGGGGGGGGNANVSRAYRDGEIPGEFPHRGVARRAPGTGGGGGGGALHLTARSIELGASSRLLARGGDAVQSIDLGGNGGAGAGGSIYIAATQALSIAEGARLDVRGGLANRLPPLVAPDQARRVYEGNLRASAVAPPTDTGSEVVGFGGRGGHGAPGRVRVELPRGTRLGMAAERGASSGVFHPERAPSFARSRFFPIGVDVADGAGSGSMVLESPTWRFTSPAVPGTRTVVLWEGARPSRDLLGARGTTIGPTADPSELRGARWARFSIHFLSDPSSAEQPSLEELRADLSIR